MTGSVLVEEEATTAPPTPPAATTTLENPNPPPVPPRESMTGSVLVEESTTPAPPPPPTAPADTVAAPPAALRKLPRRPRLRASFHYDHLDQLQLELTLMDQRRDLIHRHTVQLQDGSPLARVFEALVTVAVQAAHVAGVFGAQSGPPPTTTSDE
jgi:hypothetical protein